MRTIIPHIIYRREPIKIKNKKHTFLSWNKSRLFVIVVVSFDNCPGESRGDFFWKKITKSVTLFEFFSILYMSPQEGLNNFMTFSWGAWRSPSAFKKSDFYFLKDLSYYIYEVERASYVRGGMTPPPRYIGSRNHHGRRHIARRKSKICKKHMQKTKKEISLLPQWYFFHIYYARWCIYRAAGRPATSSFIYYI